MKFSRLFEDEITMKHLSMQQLQAVCQVLGLEFMAQIPSEKILRFQLRMKLRELEVDDKVIYELCQEKTNVYSKREADQGLCFCYIDSTNPLLPKSEISSL